MLKLKILKIPLITNIWLFVELTKMQPTYYETVVYFPGAVINKIEETFTYQ